MSSYRKAKQTVMTEWIQLNVEQVELVASKMQLLLDRLLAPDCTIDGRLRIAGVYESIMKHTKLKKRISAKQLSVVQKGCYVQFNEDLYVPGLEHWLLQNQKKMETAMKRRKTMERNQSDPRDYES